MKAMILAAGLGTRLRPLTLDRPKALVPVGNTPMIDRVITYLKGQGIQEIVLNAHHHRDQILRHLSKSSFGLPVDVRVEPEILGTGGGIRHMADARARDPFLVINGDILTDIGLPKARETHKNQKNLATLILHEQVPFNQVEIDKDMKVLDISDRNMEGRLAFTGIHIIDPVILSHIPAGTFSSIITCYREIIRSGGRIGAYVAEGHRWRDIGTVDSYREANRETLEPSPILVDSGGVIDPSARLEDWVVVGRNARIERGTELRRSILWEDVFVKEGVRVIDSIVTASRSVDRDLVQEIY